MLVCCSFVVYTNRHELCVSVRVCVCTALCPRVLTQERTKRQRSIVYFCSIQIHIRCTESKRSCQAHCTRPVTTPYHTCAHIPLAKHGHTDNGAVRRFWCDITIFDLFFISPISIHFHFFVSFRLVLLSLIQTVLCQVYYWIPLKCLIWT